MKFWFKATLFTIKSSHPNMQISPVLYSFLQAGANKGPGHEEYT